MMRGWIEGLGRGGVDGLNILGCIRLAKGGDGLTEQRRSVALPRWPPFWNLGAVHIRART